MKPIKALGKVLTENGEILIGNSGTACTTDANGKITAIFTFSENYISNARHAFGAPNACMTWCEHHSDSAKKHRFADKFLLPKFGRRIRGPAKLAAFDEQVRHVYLFVGDSSIDIGGLDSVLGPWAEKWEEVGNS
tara:strand:- start:169 stop:573 length:405 start_codon:yes stop_codon:yes gene_type:complete